jgi:UDP-N-acetylmuramate dehydrogenase
MKLCRRACINILMRHPAIKHVQEHVLIRDHGYYGIGGQVRYFFEPSCEDELCDVITYLSGHSISYLFIGGGSNTLFSDEVWPEGVISFGKMTRIEQVGSEHLLVEAGVNNTTLANFAADQNLCGAGWMNRLPGQLGGTIRMNARCYGGEISQIVEEVRCVTRDGRRMNFESPDMFRGYKNTVFMENAFAISGARIKLKHGDIAKERALMEHCQSDRIAKGQFTYPSCGCIFKNDYQAGVPSGKLLEASGVKEFRSKGLLVNPHHANFVFNTGGASSRDLLELSFAMRDAVFQKFGVWLEYEMEILGQLPQDLRALLNKKCTSTYNHPSLLDLRKKFQNQTP